MREIGTFAYRIITKSLYAAGLILTFIKLSKVYNYSTVRMVIEYERFLKNKLFLLQINGK